MRQPEQKPRRSKQNYATPLAFVQAARRRIGIASFTFDFAAEDGNEVATDWWGEELDSLSFSPRDWAVNVRKGWGWLNPPFKKIAPWAKACYEMKQQGGRIAFLVPAAVGSNWFRDYVHGKALVLLVNGRIPFMPDKPNWLYPKDCILCLYAPEIAPGYEVWTWRNAVTPAKGEPRSTWEGAA